MTYEEGTEAEKNEAMFGFAIYRGFLAKYFYIRTGNFRLFGQMDAFEKLGIILPQWEAFEDAMSQASRTYFHKEGDLDTINSLVRELTSLGSLRSSKYSDPLVDALGKFAKIQPKLFKIQTLEQFGMEPATMANVNPEYELLLEKVLNAIADPVKAIYSEDANDLLMSIDDRVLRACNI